nr:reverse transcriptase domain-containing protein [Tanacetum cinerariifolium]
MEDEFYNLVVKENDLKTYIRRFQELALLCPNMVPNSEKLIEVFIEGLPRSIEGNVTASKPQTLEEVITITQRLMEQVRGTIHTRKGSGTKRKVQYEDQTMSIPEITLPLNEINSQIPLSIVITISPPDLPIEDPEDSLIMGNEELNTIPEKESDEIIKSSVEDLIPIPSESEDTSGSDSECILPSCDDFSPIDIPKEKAMTFSNPLFNLNDDFTSSGDESLFDEDGGDVDDINDFKDGYYDLEGNIIYLESLLSDDTTPNLSHEVFLDRDLRSLSDAPIDNLMPEDKVFDPGIHDQNFSPTYSADVVMPRGLTWDLHADVATTWQPLTHSLTGGQQPLTSVSEMVNGGPPLLTVAVGRTRRKVQYEDQKVSVPGVDPEGSRRPHCTLLLVDLDIDS